VSSSARVRSVPRREQICGSVNVNHWHDGSRGIVWPRALTERALKAGKLLPNIGVSALRLLLRSFVLDDVPVLGETTAFESYDVDDDPSGGQADAGKAPVEDHVIAIGNRQGVLVAHRGWQAPDEREKTLTPRRNVGAMLYVVWRPVLSAAA